MLVGILTGLAVTLLLWFLYRGIKGNPQAFSKANLGESAKTLGFLALILMGLIGLAVLMLKH